MGDLGGPTSWKAFSCLLLFCGMILLLGWKFGGQEPQIQHVNLVCATAGDGTYDCQQKP